MVVNIHIESFMLHLKENIGPTATALDIKGKMQAQFGIPSADSILVKY